MKKFGQFASGTIAGIVGGIIGSILLIPVREYLNSYFFEICKSSTGIALGMQCIPTMVRFLVFGAPIWMGVIFIVAPLWGGFFGLIGTRIAFGYFSKRVKDVKISKVLVFWGFVSGLLSNLFVSYWAM